MPRTLNDPRHEALRVFLVEKRLKARLTQHQMAKVIRRNQSYVATIETGQRRVDAVELMELADALGFTIAEAYRRMGDVK